MPHDTPFVDVYYILFLDICQENITPVVYSHKLTEDTGGFEFLY